MDGIDHANRLIQELKIGAACTIAVAEFQKGWVRTYHVGDSQLLLISNRGRVRYQSVSHSPVGFAVEAGLLEPEQAIRHDDRHVISNFLGYQEMRMEIGPCLEMGAETLSLSLAMGCLIISLKRRLSRLCVKDDSPHPYSL